MTRSVYKYLSSSRFFRLLSGWPFRGSLLELMFEGSSSLAIKYYFSDCEENGFTLSISLGKTFEA